MAEILHILDSFIIFGQEELHNTFVLYKYCIFKDLSILLGDFIISCQYKLFVSRIPQKAIYFALKVLFFFGLFCFFVSNYYMFYAHVNTAKKG